MSREKLIFFGSAPGAVSVFASGACAIARAAAKPAPRPSANPNLPTHRATLVMTLAPEVPGVEPMDETIVTPGARFRKGAPGMVAGGGWRAGFVSSHIIRHPPPAT